MKKFEYKVVAVDQTINELAKLSPETPRHLLWEEYLNELGSDGWRLFDLRGDVIAEREIEK